MGISVSIFRSISVHGVATAASCLASSPCFVVKVDPSSRGPPPTYESVTDETEEEREGEREREKTRSLLFRCSSARRRRKGRVSKLIRVRYVRVRESLVLPSFTLTGRV